MTRSLPSNACARCGSGGGGGCSSGGGGGGSSSGVARTHIADTRMRRSRSRSRPWRAAQTSRLGQKRAATGRGRNRRSPPRPRQRPRRRRSRLRGPPAAPARLVARPPRAPRAHPADPAASNVSPDARRMCVVPNANSINHSRARARPRRRKCHRARTSAHVAALRRHRPPAAAAARARRASSERDRAVVVRRRYRTRARRPRARTAPRRALPPRAPRAVRRQLTTRAPARAAHARVSSGSAIQYNTIQYTRHVRALGAARAARISYTTRCHASAHAVRPPPRPRHTCTPDTNARNCCLCASGSSCGSCDRVLHRAYARKHLRVSSRGQCNAHATRARGPP